MIERLAFNLGSHARVPRATRPRKPAVASSAEAPHTQRAATPAAAARTGSDWAWRGLIGFTALLFLRPQDQIPHLAMLHLAELCAIVGLTAMVLARLDRKLPPLPFTPEVGGLAAFGAAMIVGIPFSFWPGGSFNDFTDIYLKLFVIVLLMVHCLDSLDRLERFTWLIVLCSGYVAAHSLVNYMRGARLVEDGRLAGAVGGIFGNPNDLALNMVVFMPFALAAAFKPGPASRRGIAGVCAVLMLATIFFTRSRGGFLGLGAMLLALVVGSVRLRPAIGVATVVVVLAAVPLAPAAFWGRMVSIFDEEKDTTGSRQARVDLMKEGLRVFAANPIMGIGLGQFINYDPADRKEAWNVTHNAPLQVASELGILGLIPFVYVIARAARAALATRRVLLPPRQRPSPGGRPHREPAPSDPAREMLLTIATALGPALIGWFVCAQFASVALNWTLYFLLGIAVAVRDIALRVEHGVPPSLVTVER
jgi:putative inorganic carbon (hco3(-)) transporter